MQKQVYVRKTAYLLLSVFLLSLAVVTAHAARLPELSEEEINKRSRELDHMPWDGVIKETNRTVVDGCINSKLTFKVVDSETMEKKIYQFEQYRPDTEEDVPVVILFPTIKGKSLVENRMTSRFCSSGVAAIVADVNGVFEIDDTPKWEIHDQSVRWGVFAVKTLIDYLYSNENFDKSKIGTMGCSLGGIGAMLIHGLDSRVSASVIVASGGNFPGLLAYSDQDDVRMLREKRMQILNMKSQKEYETEARKQIRYDPLFFNRKLNRQMVLQAVVSNDTKVPTEFQLELWTSLKRPTRYVFNLGHSGSILAFTEFYSGDVVEFFKTRSK